MFYVDQLRTPSFPIGLVKTESGFIVRSVEAGLGRWKLVAAVNSVDVDMNSVNVHHKDWLTYSGGTDRPGELSYNFSISNDLTQTVNFPMRIQDCDSPSPALLDLFLSSDASICSTMAFP